MKKRIYFYVLSILFLSVGSSNSTVRQIEPNDSEFKLEKTWATNLEKFLQPHFKGVDLRKLQPLGAIKKGACRVVIGKEDGTKPIIIV